MITAKELDLLKAQAQYEKMCQFLRQAVEDGMRADQVERGLFPQAMEMCLHMLRAFVESRGTGDEGPTIEREGKTMQRLPEPHEKRYLSIFGELMISRSVYGTREGQAIEWVPLDAAVGLPAGENSYVLEDWLQRLCVKEPYAESVENLRAWLGTTVSVRTAERINGDMAQYSDGFRQKDGIPSPEEDEGILVVTVDGTGVRMRRPLAQRLAGDAAASPSAQQSSQTTGSGRDGKKQMAYVGSVYSIDSYVRTVEDVVDEVCRRQRSSDRPRPVQKTLWAEMTHIREGETWPAVPGLFLELAVECHERDPSRQKPLVCVMDGERQFWSFQEEWFPHAVGILDLYHVMERLRAVARCIHPNGGPPESEFVNHQLRLLLQGKVGYVIRNFSRLVRTGKLSKGVKQTIQSAIGYFQNNRKHMRYDEYLAAGYPIASGAVEGACKHFVKDRMDGAGMRWEIEGAQSILSLRAIYLNGHWDDFIAYRANKEQQALYGEDAQTALAT